MKTIITILISVFALISSAQDCPPFPNPDGNKSGKFGDITYDEIKDAFKDFLDDPESEQRRSKDPNEIVGLMGYDSLQWVSAQKAVAYTIYYENDPDFAMAAAQLVNVRHKFHSNTNSYTLKLGKFGFGNYVFDVPANTSAYKERLDLQDSLGIFVDITAGFDVTKNEVFWSLQSIDPETGLPPAGTQDGFLPINDSTGKGEGFMVFYVNPNSSVITGDSITADASIVFDDNDSIPTNIWQNHLDALPPTTQLSPLPDQTTSSNTVQLNWTSQDDPGGVGVSHYDLLVSENNGTYYIHESGIDTNYYEFKGKYNTAYQFCIVAYDFVGNREEPDLTTDTGATYFYNPFIKITTPSTYAGYCQNENVLIAWNAEGVEDFILDVSSDGGLTFINIDTVQSARQYEWSIPSHFSGEDSCLIRITNVDNSLVEQSSFFPIFPVDTIYDESFTCDPEKSGIDTFATANQYGCNNIEIITTLYLPSDTTKIEYTTCKNEPYNFNGINCDTTGTYYSLLSNQNGCDSLIELNLLVLPAYEAADIQIIYEGESYTFGTQTLTTSGEYIELFETANGCDSIVTLNLLVISENENITEQTICGGDTYSWEKNNYSKTGTYTDTLANHLGNDSIVVLILTVNPVDSVAITEIICQGEQVAVGNATYTETGIFITTLSNQYGCDSVVTLNLTVNPSVTKVLNKTICEGESYTMGGKSYSSSGSFIATLVNMHGCDSIVTLNLNVNSSNTTTLNKTICDGDSFEMGGKTYSTEGVYTATLSNKYGCDSIVSLNLIINPNDAVTITDTIFEGESYLFNGTNYTQSGTYTEILTNKMGCDSIVTLELTILVPQSPYVRNAISDIQLYSNDTSSIVLDLANDVFGDPDNQGLLFNYIFDSGELPDWMSSTFANGILAFVLMPELPDTGCYNVSINAMAPSGQHISDSFQICVLSTITGLENYATRNIDVNVYPNPTKGRVTLEINGTVTSDAVLTVMNLSGKQILRKVYPDPSKQIIFNLSDQSSSIYLILLEIDDMRIIKKIILNSE